MIALIRAVIMSTATQLERTDIEQAIVEIGTEEKGSIFSKARDPDFKLDDRLALIQKTFIEEALDEVNGNKSKAAKLLGVNYQTLNKRIRSMKISALIHRA